MFFYTICWVGLHVFDINMYVLHCMYFSGTCFLGEFQVCCCVVFICLKYHILFIPFPANGPLAFIVGPFCVYKPAALNVLECARVFLQGATREGRHWVSGSTPSSFLEKAERLSHPQAAPWRPFFLALP